VTAQIAHDTGALDKPGKPAQANGGDGGGEGAGAPLLAGEAEHEPLLSKVRRFKPTYWMLTVSCLAVYGCVLPFNNVASSLLMERTCASSPPPAPSPQPRPLLRPLRLPLLLLLIFVPRSRGSYFKPSPDDCHLEHPGCQSDSNQPESSCPSGSEWAPPLPMDVKVDGKHYSELKPDDVVCTDDTWSKKGSCTEKYAPYPPPP